MYLGRLKGTDSVLHSLYVNLNAPSQRHFVWRKYGLTKQSSAFWPESRALRGVGGEQVSFKQITI